MTIATYDQLAASVASWIKRSDLTDSIPEFIRFGELRIYRDLRIRAEILCRMLWTCCPPNERGEPKPPSLGHVSDGQ